MRIERIPFMAMVLWPMCMNACLLTVMPATDALAATVIDAQQQVGAGIGYTIGQTNYPVVEQWDPQTPQGVGNANLAVTVGPFYGVSGEALLTSEFGARRFTASGSSSSSAVWGAQPQGADDVHGGGGSMFAMDFLADSSSIVLHITGILQVSLSGNPERHPEETAAAIRVYSGSQPSLIWEESLDGTTPGTRMVSRGLALVPLEQYRVEVEAISGTMASADAPALKLRSASFDVVVHIGQSPVYRFWSPVTKGHFFTISTSERDKLLADPRWTYEGIAYYALPTDSDPDCRPVYRFWSPVTRAHFFTISTSERDKLLANPRWTYEKIAFYAYPAGLQPAGTTAVFRFWSPVTKKHFYTIKTSERNKLIADPRWTYEGIAWYAYP